MADDKISPTIPDWIREKRNGWWDPPRQLLHAMRCYQKWKKVHNPFGALFSRYHVLRHRFWSIVTGADIPLNCQIAGGLLLVHPNGIVIHPESTVGPNCLILQQVTIVCGARIGGNVEIGAGAKIIRAVSVGDNAKVGANAVVLHDVPEGAIVVGIPASIVKSSHSKKTNEPSP